MLTFFTLLAVACYLIATGMQWQILQNSRPQSQTTKWLGAIGWLSHTLCLYLQLHHQGGLDLGLFNVASLIGWLVAGMVLLSSLRQPIDNLYLGVFPMAAATALVDLLIPESGAAKPYSAGVISHILLSILAYSIFTIAVLQSLLLQQQERALKHHHTRGLVATLPPLQTMEQLLFEMLGTGLALLTGALLTGFLFFEDFFAQHLLHKTVLSLIAWVLYAVLLAGRTLFGWRSRTAVRWTIGGFATLALAFFGSKIVLELFLRSQ
ncbi:cytochrome C assembly family protein [Marinobacterium arenosum]|uniref:cytochrome C assembly family protein n=1 Tax=Marinobacterium arenosum TaxID=2862496 RepID=UPI001C97C2EA|nr:cytochrome c biogenesis protein CcsA [Marinobacterium arenosum]MBY4676143.1 cytochrome c biogenesis protein CcsA [Marinobacterium arenosum]